MEGRFELARHLGDHRPAVADAIRARLTGPAGDVSVLIVRSLVSAMGQALEAAGVDPVVSWARMAHAGCAVSVIHELVAAACQVTAERAERLDVDFSSVLVFLEIVKSHVADAFPLTPGAR